MTKERLFLEVALHCVNYGEGADFEFYEVVMTNFLDPVQRLYNIKYPEEEDFDDRDNGEQEYGIALANWNEQIAVLQKEISVYLQSKIDSLT